jgi:dihydrofolate reductase
LIWTRIKERTVTGKPDLHIIVAMTRDRLIGTNGKLPWHISKDLKLFRSLTMGHAVLMGRRTFNSVGASLDGRHNIVLSSTEFPAAGIEVFASFADGLQRAGEIDSEIFCIGGTRIYREALPLATHLHISWVDGDYTGDTFFPEFELDDWQEIERKRYENFTHVTYQRKREQN